VGLGDTRLDLAFGLDFNLAQLPPQTDDVFGQIEQGPLEAAHFTFDARPGNRKLARLVDQTVDQVGPDAESCALRASLDIMVAVDIRSLGNRGGRFATCRSRDQAGRIELCALAGAQTLGSLGQHVAAILDLVDECRSCRLGAENVLDARLQQMREFAEVHRTRHPRIPLEGMQQTGNGVRLGIARRITAPQAQLHGQFAQLVLSLLKKDRQQVLVEVILEPCDNRGRGLHHGLARRRRRRFRRSLKLFLKNAWLLDGRGFGLRFEKVYIFKRSN